MSTRTLSITLDSRSLEYLGHLSGGRLPVAGGRQDADPTRHPQVGADRGAIAAGAHCGSPPPPPPPPPPTGCGEWGEPL